MTIRQFIEMLARHLGISYEQAENITLKTAAKIMEPQYEIVETTGVVTWEEQPSSDCG